MTTAREVCIDALKESGGLGVGQTPLAEDINDAFTRMKRMVAVWQTKRWLVPSLQRVSFTTLGQRSYTIGLGGDINIKRPDDIKAAYVIQLNTNATPVSLPVKKIFSYESYALIALKDLASLPTHFFYDAQFPLANLFIYPIGQSGQYQIDIIIKSLLGFGTTVDRGTIIDGGTLYTDAEYTNVALTGGSGTGATATINVNSGVVTNVALETGGQDYAIGDVLSVDAATMGGTGSGFEWEVGNITSNLDTEIVMPEEYEEALMYNLALRCCSMYQIQPMPDTKRFARAALNTIRVVNTQVPTLTMPNAPGLRVGPAFNLYNPDGN